MANTPSTAEAGRGAIHPSMHPSMHAQNMHMAACRLAAQAQPCTWRGCSVLSTVALRMWMDRHVHAPA